jgi:hypothetical protein
MSMSAASVFFLLFVTTSLLLTWRRPTHPLGR